MLRRIGLGAGTALLVVATLTWSTTPASAQRHGGGHMSGYGGYHGGYGGYGGYHGGYYGGRYGYGYPGFQGGRGLGLGLGYLYPGYGYSPNYDYGYVPDYTYNPGYYGSSPSSPAFADTYQPPVNLYSPQLNTLPATSGAAPVLVQVKVPLDAEVWFGGTKTTLTGPTRLFESPPITSDKNYTYEIRAHWMQDGKEVTRTRTIPVHPGERVSVDLTQPEPTQPAAVQTPPPAPAPLEPAPAK